MVTTQTRLQLNSTTAFRRWSFFCTLVLVLGVSAVFGQIVTEQRPDGDQQTVEVDGNPETQVFIFGKNVIVRGAAREVLVFGGNAIIEGRVGGDVGAIGGVIVQAPDAYIGGDVIVLGGAYRPAISSPLRDPAKETVIIGVFEDELRSFARNPVEILSPALTWSFLVQRLVSVLFWFLLTFAATTISPGAISRAVARFQLSALKIMAIGASAFVVTTVGIIISVSFLPGYLSGVVGLMTFFLLMIAYVYGRVTLQLSLGKLLQRRILPETKQSETAAILIGVTVWTLILSIPYVWTVALVVLFSVSLGLVFTARRGDSWQSQ